MSEKFIEGLYPGAAFQGFHYDEILFETQTAYQSICIYRAPVLGRVLVLDGVIQTTEADEFVYHEMLTHVALMSVDAPQRVLIVGGGDGGILREVLKHPVAHVDFVEIDRGVVDSARRYLPFLNDGGRCFDDARVDLVIADAFQYLKDHNHSYDAILVDSTDPVGMAEALYSYEFYRLCCQSLSAKGVLTAQDGVVFFQRDEAARTIAALRGRGLHAGAYVAAVPTYYGGLMTFGIGARLAAAMTPDIEILRRRFAALGAQTRHYSPEIHVASFVLPRWINDAVEGIAS